MTQIPNPFFGSSPSLVINSFLATDVCGAVLQSELADYLLCKGSVQWRLLFGIEVPTPHSAASRVPLEDLSVKLNKDR